MKAYRYRNKEWVFIISRYVNYIEEGENVMN